MTLDIALDADPEWDSSTDWGRLARSAVTAAIAVGVAVWMLRERKGWDVAALGLVLGGALGNIRDRWMYGYVVDYADLHFGEFRPFLIFNLADAAITVGVVIILARSLFIRETEDAGDTPPESMAQRPGQQMAQQTASSNTVTPAVHETREHP